MVGDAACLWPFSFTLSTGSNVSLCQYQTRWVLYTLQQKKKKRKVKRIVPLGMLKLNPGVREQSQVTTISFGSFFNSMTRE